MYKPPSVTYPLKREVIRYLAEPGHWQSRFSMEALLAEERKWKRAKAERGLSVHYDDDVGIAIIHHDNGASLRIEKHGRTTSIEDETGRVVFASKDKGVNRRGNHKTKIDYYSYGNECDSDSAVATFNVRGICFLLTL